MSDMTAKVGEWWVCNIISIMGNGDCQSAYKMDAGLIIAGNVKPIERLYTEEERDRMAEEIAELNGALVKIRSVSMRTPELKEDYTHDDVGILDDRINEVFGIVETALAKPNKNN